MRGPLRAEEPGSGPGSGVWAAGGGGGEHEWLRAAVDAATNELGAQTPSRREAAPGGACGGRPARRRPGGPGGGGDPGGSEPPSLPFHLPSSAPGDRGRPERATAWSCLPSGSPGTRAPLRRSLHPLHSPTALNPPPSPALCSGSGPSRGVIFTPGLVRSGLLLPGSALFN